MTDLLAKAATIEADEIKRALRGTGVKITMTADMPDGRQIALQCPLRGEAEYDDLVLTALGRSVLQAIRYPELGYPK